MNDQGDGVRFGGKGIAIAGVISGTGIAIGLPALVLIFGKDLGSVIETVLIILALLVGGGVAGIAAFFGTVIPSFVGESGPRHAPAAPATPKPDQP